jgi:flagellar M-ring protein FliF
MNEWLTNLWTQIRSMPRAQLAALAATGIGSLLFFGWLAVSGSRVEERLLFRGLDEAEASRVVTALEAEKIAYRLEDGGTSIFVPADKVYEARIRLAARGCPRAAGPASRSSTRAVSGSPTS